MLNKGIAIGFIFVIITSLVAFIVTSIFYMYYQYQIVSVSIIVASVLYFSIYFGGKYLYRLKHKDDFPELNLNNNEYVVLEGLFQEQLEDAEVDGMLVLTNKQLIFQYPDRNDCYYFSKQAITVNLDSILKFVYTGISFEFYDNKKHIKIDYANDWSSLIEKYQSA